MFIAPSMDASGFLAGRAVATLSAGIIAIASAGSK